MTKPFSQACINNRDFILEKLRSLFSHQTRVLEVGSGTGQHAVYFSERLPHVEWQTSDLIENHGGILEWLNEQSLSNCLSPIEIDVASTTWSSKQYNAIFTANTLHIMSWQHVLLFFQNLSSVLQDNGLVIIYGPFNYHGKYTSDSNARFDLFLKENNPASGIRNIEDITQAAEGNGMTLADDYNMPANNRLLVFKKEG